MTSTRSNVCVLNDVHWVQMSNFGLTPGSENHPRVNASQIRERDYHRKKISAYEREYNSNTSSISLRQKRLRESLLAYTERVQSTSRHPEVPSQYHRTQDGELVVRAKQIRRNANAKDKGHRQVLTLQELLNRGPNTKVERLEHDARTSREHDARKPSYVLSNTSQTRSEDSVKLSKVTASDLNEVLECDMTPIKPRNSDESRENSNENRPIPRKLPPLRDNQHIHRKLSQPTDNLDIHHKLPKMTDNLDIHQQLTANSTRDFYVVLSDDQSKVDVKPRPTGSVVQPLHTTRKRRMSGSKSRLKRMRLPTSTLNQIPEDDLLEEDIPEVVDSTLLRQVLVTSASKVHSRVRNTLSEHRNRHSQPTESPTEHIPHAAVRDSHRKRENDRIDIGHTVPYKRSYRGVTNDGDNVTNGNVVIKQDETKTSLGDQNSSRRRHKSSSKAKTKTGYPRLVFLRDSPNRAD